MHVPYERQAFFASTTPQDLIWKCGSAISKKHITTLVSFTSGHSSWVPFGTVRTLLHHARLNPAWAKKNIPDTNAQGNRVVLFRIPSFILSRHHVKSAKATETRVDPYTGVLPSSESIPVPIKWWRPCTRMLHIMQFPNFPKWVVSLLASFNYFRIQLSWEK